MNIEKEKIKYKKYSSDSERQENRKLQNRINQRRCRLKKKIVKTISQKKGISKQDYFNFFNQFDFNYYLTGTLSMDSIHNIHSLRKYTSTYIDNIFRNGIIERALITFEGGTDKNYHTHILIQTNENLKTVKELEFKWLKGKMDIRIINTSSDKENLIKYSFKEVNLNPVDTLDLYKLDYWFLVGNF